MNFDELVGDLRINPRVPNKDESRILKERNCRVCNTCLRVYPFEHFIYDRTNQNYKSKCAGCRGAKLPEKKMAHAMAENDFQWAIDADNAAWIYEKADEEQWHKEIDEYYKHNNGSYVAVMQGIATIFMRPASTEEHAAYTEPHLSPEDAMKKALLEEICVKSPNDVERILMGENADMLEQLEVLTALPYYHRKGIVSFTENASNWLAKAAEVAESYLVYGKEYDKDFFATYFPAVELDGESNLLYENRELRDKNLELSRQLATARQTIKILSDNSFHATMYSKLEGRITALEHIVYEKGKK